MDWPRPLNLVETRDPFQEKIRREDSFQSDWDRYAHVEYNRLAQEEEDGCVYTVWMRRYQLLFDEVKPSFNLS